MGMEPDQVEALRRRAADLARAWQVQRDGAEIVTDAALLWPGVQGGRAVMLKVMGAASDEGGAAALLVALGGRGAVRVLAQGEGALLMERIDAVGPGLAEMALGGQDEAGMHVLCGLARDWRDGLRGADLPGLFALDIRMGALRRTEGVPPELGRLFVWAVALADQMLADRSGWTALHGDLHHGNALQDAQRGWLAFDPKGVFGPPVYDLANALLNPYPHLDLILDPARMARQAANVAGHLALTEREVLRWVCLHGCLSAAWHGTGGHWMAGARVAGTLAGLNVPH